MAPINYHLDNRACKLGCMADIYCYVQKCCERTSYNSKDTDRIPCMPVIRGCIAASPGLCPATIVSST